MFFIRSFRFSRSIQPNHGISKSATFGSLATDPCDSCNAASSSTATDPPQKYSKSRSMLNSVKPYGRHIIIFKSEEPTSWPRSIESEESTFTFRVSEYLTANKSKQFPIKLTACHDESKSIDHSMTQVAIYPENIIVKIQNHQAERFAEIINSRDKIKCESLLDLGVEYEPITWKKLVLVCIHGNRDKKCHLHGTQIIATLKQELTRRDFGDNEVKILGSSHIGGHEFAGTLISYPSGNWYGMVTNDKVPELLDHILNDTVMTQCFRGNPNMQW